MNPSSKRRLLGAVLLAVGSTCHGLAHGAAAPTEDSPWEVLVPSGRIGRFGLRVERAAFAGTIPQVASRLAQAWAAEPWPVIADDGTAGPALSRLTQAGVETIRLRAAGIGRVEAQRSVLEWRAQGAPSPRSPGTPDGRMVPDPAFVSALGILGEPLASFSSTDGGTANLTRTWLAPVDVGSVARRVERAASRHELSTLLRFDAPDDAPESLRGGRVLAFGGGGVVAIVTLNIHPAGTAVVVHCQERLP